jgi:hypothetical protein
MSSESEDEEDDTGFEMHAAVSPTVSSAAGATESLAAETAQLNPDAAASVGAWNLHAVPMHHYLDAPGLCTEACRPRSA